MAPTMSVLLLDESLNTIFAALKINFFRFFNKVLKDRLITVLRLKLYQLVQKAKYSMYYSQPCTQIRELKDSTGTGTYRQIIHKN